MSTLALFALLTIVIMGSAYLLIDRVSKTRLGRNKVVIAAWLVIVAVLIVTSALRWWS